MENIILLLIFGVIAGVFAGMGMGGGTFLIPLLMIFCSFSQLQAQSVNLVAFIPMSVVALIIHIKNKYVCYKQALTLIFYALIGCVLGVCILNYIDLKILKVCYSIFLLTIGVYLFIDAIIKKRT